MALVLTLTDVSPETWCQDISSKPVMLGRDEAADIRFDHRSVSRQHCRIWIENDECFVEDCGSMNGTYVNANRVQKSPLSSGDRLLVGKFDLVVARDTEIRDTVDGVINDTVEVVDRNPEEEIRHLAAVVHDRLTPSRRIGIPGVFLEVVYAPSGMLGGDCFLCVEAGEQWVFCIFDAMYHGTKSALALSLLRTELERCVNLTSQPARCLDWLNTELLALGANDLYTSACIATWFPQTQLLYYSTAGLHPPVLLRKGEEIELAPSAGGMPLGVSMTEEFEERLVQLKQHDRFFLFSDGVSESCQPSPDLPLVRQAARQLLVGHALPLNDHIHGFVEDARQRSRDDILLVGGEVTGTM
jgi:hypothetical protein